MATEFSREFFSENRIVKADLRAAHQLREEDIARIKAEVKKLYDATEVILNVSVDESLLSGYVLQVGGRVFDTSGKSALAAITADAPSLAVMHRDNQLHHPFQTSWGVSTRLVGAIIMTHGDDDGLILPPAVAPIQVVVVPIAAHKPGVSEKAAELAEKISKYARVKLDDSDNAPGWKFAQWEMKGVPLRLEIGPKDLEKNQCVLVRRDTREKVFVSLDELETAIPAQLEALRKDLYQRALANREKRTWAATTMDEVKELAKANTGYIKTMWCGDLACEMKMKEEAGLSSRCMPFEQEQLSDVCPCCGKPAKAMVYWGVAY